MLQKSSAQKKVVISEKAADFEHGFGKEHGKESLAELKQSPSGTADAVPLITQVGKVSLGKYPGYKGHVQIKGTVDMTVAKGVVSLSWSFTGTEDACNSTHQELLRLNSKDKKNGCGLHIHKGTTCDKASEIGGHYYHESALSKMPLPFLLQSKDPWADVAYGNENGVSVGSTKVAVGLDMVE